jgi:hypothetical protein
MTWQENERQERERRIKDQRLRQEAVHAAQAVLEQCPEFPEACIQIEGRDLENERDMPTAAKDRSREPRLEYLLKYLDNRGEGYLQLVRSRELHKAFMVFLDDFVRVTWWNFSGIPIEAIPPTSPFSDSTPIPLQLQRDRLVARGRYWIVKGYERLTSLDKAQRTVPSDQTPEETPSISHRLDEAIAILDITHDELALRMGIGKTTYFAVKAGRGKKSTQLRVAQYLKKLNKPEPDK